MAWDEGHVIAQGPQFLDYRSYELFMVSSRKVGPSYGPHKKNISHECDQRFVEEHHMTGSVAWAM